MTFPAYSFVVKALPDENPDHIFIAVLLDGRLAREWRIPKETAAKLDRDLNTELAKLGD